MPTATMDYTSDTWHLSLEAYASGAAFAYGDLPLSFSLTGLIANVSGPGYAGIFQASDRVLDQRTFSALVSDQEAKVYLATGTMSDNGSEVFIVSLTLTLVTDGELGNFPNYVTYQGTAWSYTHSGVEVGTVTDTSVTLPVVGGVILLQEPGTYSPEQASANISTHRVLTGAVTFPGQPTEEVIITPIDVDELATLTTSAEARIHAIVGAPYGDLEVDIGKSVPWTRWFSDDMFITDINLGDPRYWVVDWDKTSPQSKFVSLGINFFANPVAWRQAQFAAADAAWGYSDEDWVLFLDGSEALSCDTRSQPDDVGTSPFRAYIHREVARAVALGQDKVSIPFYAYVREATQPDARRFVDIQDPASVAESLQGTAYSVSDVNTVVLNVATPYYYQRNLSGNGSGLVRLVKVSTLRSTFDWSTIDTLGEPSADVKLQIISYAYAQWTNPATGNNDGLSMRALISQVRPLLGLPANGVGDASGTAGPYLVGVDGQITQVDGVGTSAPLLTPMYTSLFRNSPQDGVWYLPRVTAPEVPPPPFAYSFPPPHANGVSYDAVVEVV